jgi:Holliday junction DNA helicase RuvA
MIGKLSGRVDTVLEHGLILDVNGVGYIVQASARTLGRLGGAGSSAHLLIDTHVREDAISLYGFSDAAEQRWFRLLTSVQGVGPKAGLSILSACPPERLPLVIAAQDKPALQAAEGVGPKLALRILTELKDKVASFETGPLKSSNVSRETKQEQSSHSAEFTLHQDAVSALVNLGYGRSEAFEAVARVQPQAGEHANDDLQNVIRLALKVLST